MPQERLDRIRELMYRKPGLWISALSIEVEDVVKAHKKPCYNCGRVPVGRRLSLSQGSGRSTISAVLCVECGSCVLKLLKDEALRAVEFLDSSHHPGPPDSIRRDAVQREENFNWPFDRLRKERAEKSKAKKEAKRAAAKLPKTPAA
jgi:hypothetical protein